MPPPAAPSAPYTYCVEVHCVSGLAPPSLARPVLIASFPLPLAGAAGDTDTDTLTLPLVVDLKGEDISVSVYTLNHLYFRSGAAALTLHTFLSRNWHPFFFPLPFSSPNSYL